MSHRRIAYAAVFLLLAGCSNVPTVPDRDDNRSPGQSSTRHSAEPMPVNGGTFGSGTITADPIMQSNAADSTDTSISRGGNMFGSGT